MALAPQRPFIQDKLGKSFPLFGSLFPNKKTEY